MATSKTLTPTNQTISIPELTDAPDMSVPADAIDKEADAINAIDNKITRPNNFLSGSVSLLSLYNSLPVGYYSSANGGIGNWWVENASNITDLPSGVTLGNYVNITIKRMGSTGSVFLESSTGSVELSIVGTTITVVTDKTLNSNLNTKTKYETESNTLTNGQLIDTTGANYTNIQRFGRVVVINFQCKIKSTATDSGNELYYFSNLTKWQPQNISRGWVCENGKSTATGIMGYCGVDTWTEDGQTVLGIYLSKASAFAGKNILGQITYMLKNEST